jgi:AcrR family transcriptional regulator
MKEIAAKSGVSTGALYHYFSSKEDMLTHMIAWIGDENVAEYLRRTSSTESISDLFDMTVNYWKKHDELYENSMLLAFDEPDEYNKQIAFLEAILRPLIVDATNNPEKAVDKIKKIISVLLINASVTVKEIVVK